MCKLQERPHQQHHVLPLAIINCGIQRLLSCLYEMAANMDDQAAGWRHIAKTSTAMADFFVETWAPWICTPSLS